MSKNKVILVILDGLSYQTGHDCMGYLQALCEQDHARLYKLRCELPSMSRPLYECILTGTAPAVNGVVHNDVIRNSNQQSIFSLARENGLRTAAAAYHWVSELYNTAPYDAVRDRHTEDENQLIPYGVFYNVDHYPDDHLFLDAEWLRCKFDPDFLLVHPMNIDDAGHKAGADSSKYRNTTRNVDRVLSIHLPEWIKAGYQVLVTADHGMNDDLSHGGVLPQEREVPLFVIGDQFTFADRAIQQIELCGTICSLLGIEHSKPTSQEAIRL